MSETTISKEEVAHVANLAKLAFDDGIVVLALGAAGMLHMH